MLMGKQMVLTIFIIAVALGTETEFQLRIGLFRSSANRTFMTGNPRRMVHFPSKLLPLLHLLGAHSDAVFGCKVKHQEIEQG